MIIQSSNLDEFVEEHPEDFKVMMVANLLLMSSDTSYLNSLFRDHYMSKFFRKSFQSLDLDMMVVLGDVLAKGSELTKTKWVSLSSKSVSWIARRFPGLDSPGCGAFEISNVSFLSLNTIALLCGNNDLDGSYPYLSPKVPYNYTRIFFFIFLLIMVSSSTYTHSQSLRTYATSSMLISSYSGSPILNDGMTIHLSNEMQ
ncbi:hypothetical protein UlMin_005753 [Ulmus minor]